MSLRFTRVKFTVAELRTLPEEVLVAYLSVGLINNDLSTLLKLIVRARPTADEPPLVWNARFAMSVMFVAYAAGRTNEAWITLNRHLNRIEREFGLVSKMSESQQNIWADVKRYFSHPNPIVKVRDKVAFHSDTNHLIDALKIIPPSHELIDFHLDTRADCVFGTAEVVRLAAISSLLEKDDLVSGFLELSDHTVAQVKNIVEVGWGFLAVTLQEYFPEKLKALGFEHLDVELQPITTPLSFFYSVDT